MPSNRPFRLPVRTAATCLFVALGVSACHDAAADPMAVVLTAESRATLDLRTELPSLPDVVGRAGFETDLAGAIDLWLGSWEREPDEARVLRLEAYERVAGPGAGALGPAGVEGAHGRVGAALRAVGDVSPDHLTEPMEARVRVARQWHEEAGSLLAEGSTDRALQSTLRSADALREVGPEGVARMLAARAARALEGLRTGAEAEDPAVQRGERLLLGARLDLDEGNWSRATRRAFYACQVLGVSPR